MSSPPFQGWVMAPRVGDPHPCYTRDATMTNLSLARAGRFVLDAGQTPHAPHEHQEEEVMIIESGTGEIFCDGPGEKGVYLLVPAPQLDIRVSNIAPVQTVAIDMEVIPGRRYALESSGDLQTWTLLGTSFTAETDTVTRELETIEGGHYYRLTLLP